MGAIMGLSLRGYPATTGPFGPMPSGDSHSSEGLRLRGILQFAGQPQAFPGVSLGEGAPEGFPNLLTCPPRSNTANFPGSQTMPVYRLNKSNATSKYAQKRHCCLSVWRKQERSPSRPPTPLLLSPVSVQGPGSSEEGPGWSP